MLLVALQKKEIKRLGINKKFKWRCYDLIDIVNLFYIINYFL